MAKTPSEPSEPTSGQPGPGPGGTAAGATTATGGATQYAATGDTPGALTAGYAGPGCGDRSNLLFLDPPPAGSLERIPVAGIDPANLRTAGDAYYEGALERIGAFRAIDELVKRFLGGLNLTSSALRSALCDYMRQEPLRLSPEERDPVLSLFEDATLERLLLRFSDASIAFDLSARPESTALTPVAVPVEAARLAVVAAIEDLELFLDDKGGGGVSFVTNEVGTQLMDILQILNDPDLPNHVPGDDVDDVFSVITGLLPGDKDLPTDLEARQLARKASAGRRIFVEIANRIDPLVVAGDASDVSSVGGFTDEELQSIGVFAYEWRAAQGSVYGPMYIAGVDDAADGQVADENRLKVIRLRPARAI